MYNNLKCIYDASYMCFRHWLVTKNGDMTTMKQSARLTLIRTSVEGDFLCLDADGMDTLKLPLRPEIDDKQITTVT